VNARKTNIEPSPAFVLNVRTIGIKVPLMVRANGDGYKVTDGGKRYRALMAIAKAEQEVKGIAVGPAYPVPVIIEDADDQQARDTSLALNLLRDDMHPVDEFEQVTALITGGDTVEAIALRYGRTAKEVNQALALGALAPSIRAAWRSGDITTETAKAFTLARDHGDQEKLFARLKKDSRLADWAVRRELKADDLELGKLVAFLGEEGCAAAGVKVTRDLFKDNVAIVDERDTVKLHHAADAKLNAECDRLVAEGWGWAIRQPANLGYMPRDHVKPAPTKEEAERLAAIEKVLEAAQEGDAELDYTEEEKLEDEARAIRHAAELRGTKPKFRKEHGCIVDIDDEGKLEIKYGYKQPPRTATKESVAAGGAASEALTKARKKTGAGTPAVSNALNQRLSEQLTDAASDVLRTDPRMGLVALVAGMSAQSSGYGSDNPIDANVNGLRIKQGGAGGKGSFLSIFEGLLTAKLDAVQLQLAALAARAIDLQERGGKSPMASKATAALCNALDGAAMIAAIRKRWDAKDYFANVAGALRMKAAVDALGDDTARALSKLKKDEAVKWCVTNIPPTGWLPPELRTAHYHGPKVKAAARVKPAKKAAKKKGR
jgi:ParB family chromosome partitioning protein